MPSARSAPPSRPRAAERPSGVWILVMWWPLPGAARVAGARRFMVVSAMGASARSVIFYLRVKGDTEEALTALGYPALHIFRPGLLLGLRAESRPWEALGMTLAPFLNSLMVGPAKAYRGIPAATVAAAMIAAAGMARTGQHIHTYADMMAPEGIK